MHFAVWHCTAADNEAGQQLEKLDAQKDALRFWHELFSRITTCAFFLHILSFSPSTVSYKLAITKCHFL